MPRYALLIEYDGTPFLGWQRQKDGLTVQQVLEEAAAPLNGGVEPAIGGAGRTDTGVHAEGQVAQVELAADLPVERVREALNTRTRPYPVSVLSVARPPEEWNARFSAVHRAYRYRILNRRARPGLDLGRVWHVPQRLDAGAMHEAAQMLLGHHDFSAFRAAACQAKDALRTLDRLDVSRFGDEVVVTVEARSFLHHQVRNMVGTLAQVGRGARPVNWPRAVLDGRDRTRAGQTAPPDGLCFTAVRYDPPLEWPI
ncbi:tRNA pseudouridine(38-40) synthase TruA [Roseomonas xinghualingensis]|uniref:tRNA pseudouridine(38-40) synthase TruA n=1 Tax=Roseomonas xinghualingensis TaxID=2986475 RepID=UPI0021F0BECE|nr:tRNA pseudouridine(38-40) synthase TruA [Roseomonas sp. SXEYE001]MCV4207987.1 tRNA pseudouridine(38-40) synthase TruA [Roseomonas sp. SXEYE001]